MFLAPGTVIGGKYRIERALARGGMGSVWIARHVQLGSAVALKFLDASLAASPAHRTRFEREARAAANLRSPHVVHVMDYGFEGAAPYLVMELLEGEDLDQRLKRVGRLSLADTARVFTQVGKALRKAHEAGIVHRDLKPANLFIARIEDEEVVKVLDFGIAKEAGAALGDATKTGEVMGSPHYMSPEQVRAERDIDARTDLWSLGIILYRAIVGDLPFPGDQLGPVLAKILTDPTPVPSRTAPDLPPSIDAFMARALARDRTQRFQSVAEMVEAFHVAAGRASPGAALPASGPAAVPYGPGSGAVSSTGPGAAMPYGYAASGPGVSGSGPHGVLAQSGPMVSPGTAGGLVATAPAARPSSGAAVAIVVGLVALLGVAGAITLFVVRSSSADQPGDSASGAAAEVASGASSVGAAQASGAGEAPPASSAGDSGPSSPPAPTPSAPGSSAPTTSAAASVSGAVTAKPVVSAPVSKPPPKPSSTPTPPPKPSSTPTTTKPKEKWF